MTTLAIVLPFLAACGSTAPSAPQVPSGTVTVNGNERLGWDQSSPDGIVSWYSYVAYVDSSRQPLPAATCSPNPDGTQAQCVSPLPRMTAGLHRLELATIINTIGFDVEGPRSAPLQLNVLSATSGATSATAAGSNVPTTVTATQAARATPASSAAESARDGTSFVVETLATGLNMPSAIAALPDGRVLIAERSGVVRVWTGRGLLRGIALQLNAVAAAPDVGFVDITISPEFATTHYVYVAYTLRSDDGRLVNRIVRFRELENVLGEPAVIIEDRVAQMPQRTPRIRFGRDRKLYAVFPAAHDRTALTDSGSYAGTILRLNEDGTTPADNRGLSPVLGRGYRAPGAPDWQPQTGRVWMTDRDGSGRDVLRAGIPPDGPGFTFDPVIDSTAAAFYTSTKIGGFTGDLFIAGLDGTQIRRVHFDPRDPSRVIASEPLVYQRFGRIGDVVAGPDGAIYFCTSNVRNPTAAPADRLLRIAPVPAAR